MNARVNPLNGIGMTSLRTRQRLVGRLREAGIRNEAVLQVMVDIPRHLFVEEALASRAYENTALPIGFGQTISQPFIVALMTEALLDGRSPRKVLEIGTGSAYQTAVLATLIEQVYSLERVGRLLERAAERLQLLNLNNVHLQHGDGSLGWLEHSPYDSIIVTAATQEIPPLLLDQLSVGGLLIVPLGSPTSQELIRLERKINGFEKRTLGLVSFVPLLEGVL